MFGAYRLDQYSDPDSFMLQVAVVFSQYEGAVLLRATDPRRRDCLQRRFKFPPSLYEISESLDELTKVVKAQEHVAERESRGFFYRDGRFLNAGGEKYDPEKHRNLPRIAEAGR
jgi:hypothetical protein